MDYTELPGLGRPVSRIGAGCWTIGGPAVNNGKPIGWEGVDEDAAYAGLVRSRDLGVTLFDTADVYGLGRSERLIGRLLAEMRRDELVISSKVGYFAGTARHPYLQRQIRHQLATTLDNLGTDYLDLYHLHSTDFGPQDAYLAPAIWTLRRLREEGLIRAVGIRAPHRFAAEWATDPDHPHAAEARRFLALYAAVRPDAITVRHNLMTPLYRPDETDVLALARRDGVGVLLKQTLGQGLLLGTYRNRTEQGFSSADHRSRKPVSSTLVSLVEHAVGRIGQRFGTARSDLARVAIQYALHTAPGAVALVGFRDATQITDNLARSGEPLTDQNLHFLHRVMSPVRENLTESGPLAGPAQKNRPTDHQ
ncbi:aldo/keto reductase [Streptomyces jumonjinensis]|uniref:Aldo/keto reductase n=1 Tax=Streptomyces jumonjinensis TaxID=1945 RepID=A0A646KLW7_STRJU|nr:aldo/keto reductase [Streptomyces jumonjinensis]MQT01966.1 aldo/keto reductase [Streptomyces jumonjinensis]